MDLWCGVYTDQKYSFVSWKEQLTLNTAEHCVLGLSDTTVLSIYRNILKYRYRDILLLTIVIPCLYITIIKNLFVILY